MAFYHQLWFLAVVQKLLSVASVPPDRIPKEPP